jgi:addiction module HigA family antidote
MTTRTSRIPTNRIPTHPGVILLEESLEPMEITQVRLAEALGISNQRVNEIVNGKRGITPETAWLFARAFKTSPEFWMNLQVQHDLAKERPQTLRAISL